MSDGDTPRAEGYVRHRKIRGTHRMYCPVRERKVVLGKGREDGNVAYLAPAGMPAASNESWERIDHDNYVAEAAEQEMTEKAGEPEGTLKIEEVGEEAYNVVNTVTGEPMNTSPVSREEAEALISGSPEEKKGLLARPKDKVTDADKDDSGDKEDSSSEECPVGHRFGKDHDEHEECDECPLAESCQEAKG